MTERLQKILSAAGVCSRRKAEEWIQKGCVTVNGTTAILGQSADPETDEICLNGQRISGRDRPVYIMLHKPRGYVTTLSDEKGRPNVADLVDCGVRVYPVGRLDLDSEGLLIMTNDGAFANRLMHPKEEIEKVYEVWVEGFYPGGERALSRSIQLDGYTIRPPKVQIITSQTASARLLITIHEGRNRQVRRMCQAAGMRVTRLRRVAEGSIRLGELKKGTWRYLTEQEICELQK